MRPVTEAAEQYFFKGGFELPEYDVDKGYRTMKEKEEACCCGEKQTIRSQEQKKALMNRLKRLEGQVRGIQSMLEKDAYCNDILVQSAAVSAAINAFNKEILAYHIHNCVVRDIREGKDEVVDELVTTVQKLMR